MRVLDTSPLRRVPRSGDETLDCANLRYTCARRSREGPVMTPSRRRWLIGIPLVLAAFRAEMAQVNDPARRYIVNFHRGPLFGKGGGHHSPVAAYLPEQDLVLVADVNRTFQPWLVSTDRLFQAVDTVDPSGKQKRGLLRIE
jgi:hypothetical protein